MEQHDSFKPGRQLEGNISAPSIRYLKIEAHGDRWKGVKPKIRLTGLWLERAGFQPGQHVRVLCLAPGLIELRSSESRCNGE